MTLLIYDDIFLQHDTGYGHPENAKRLENTVKYLQASGLWDQLRVERPRAASLEEVKLVHPQILHRDHQADSRYRVVGWMAIR